MSTKNFDPLEKRIPAKQPGFLFSCRMMGIKRATTLSGGGLFFSFLGTWFRATAPAGRLSPNPAPRAPILTRFLRGQLNSLGFSYARVCASFVTLKLPDGKFHMTMSKIGHA